MFQRLEKGLRATGEEQDGNLAQAISALFNLRGSDLPLGEVPDNIQLFSDEAREQLAKEKYIIYPHYWTINKNTKRCRSSVLVNLA